MLWRYWSLKMIKQSLNVDLNFPPTHWRHVSCPQTCLQCITIRIYISVEWQPTLHYRQYLSRCKFGISFKCKMGDTVSRRGAEFRMESITLRRSQAFVNDNEGGIFGGKKPWTHLRKQLPPFFEREHHAMLKTETKEHSTLSSRGKVLSKAEPPP